jgi:hypothetical protein
VVVGSTIYSRFDKQSKGRGIRDSRLGARRPDLPMNGSRDQRGMSGEVNKDEDMVGDVRLRPISVGG